LVRHRDRTGKSGSFKVSVTFLHSPSNRLVFITEDIVPAYFSPGDVDREIARISKGFDQTARVLTANASPVFPHATLATWGDVTLTPLNEAALDALRRGEEIHQGLVADFIGDARESARRGLPVFKLGGGSGFQVGKSKATLWRAAKTGALSVTKNEAGQILVDSSELFRVFQAKRSEPRVMSQDATVHVTHEADDTALRLAVAETKIEALHAMVQELQRARDAWQAQAERLALMAPTVIAAPGPVATPEAPAPRQSWFRWWFYRGQRAPRLAEAQQVSDCEHF
jgi:hypothetical protein